MVDGPRRYADTPLRPTFKTRAGLSTNYQTAAALL
jgi:hypothetical protein